MPCLSMPTTATPDLRSAPLLEREDAVLIHVPPGITQWLEVAQVGIASCSCAATATPGGGEGGAGAVCVRE